MKCFAGYVATAIVLIVASCSGSLAADKQVRYTIGVNPEPADGTCLWRLGTTDKAYFEGRSRPRTANDILSADPFGANPDYEFDLVDMPKGIVRIRVIKVGKRTTEWTKYLSADYSVIPPVVIARDKPDETSDWRVTPSDKPDKSFFENVHPGEKQMWLAVDPNPILVRLGGPDGKEVLEYSRAILSSDNKEPFHVGKLQNLEK